MQFLHPGGEHGCDETGVKGWNRGDHKRKFIRTRGRLVEGGRELSEQEIVFWGEWEPPSRVTWVDDPVPHGPRFIHEPFLPLAPPDEWRQNTDPFVFGDSFHYTGCLQHTKFGPTQLRYLSRGSVILFGSRVGGSHFALDTVFVVDRHVDHSLSRVGDARRQVSSAYAAATLDPWYAADAPEDRSYRLYFGATVADPVASMFSFFPATRAGDAPHGFARPAIVLPEAITPTMAQGKRLNKQVEVARVRELWERVLGQVLESGLLAGVYAELPPVLDSASSQRGS